MTSTLATRRDRQQRRPAGPTARRVGYAVAAVCNAAFLWIAHQLLDWGWPDFLTDEFDELLPIVTFSFGVGIIVNLALIGYDPPWFRSVCSITTSAIGFVVAVRTYQVFPFDFSSYDVDWSWLARLVVIIVVVGSALGVIVEAVKLATGRATEWRPAPPRSASAAQQSRGACEPGTRDTRSADPQGTPHRWHAAGRPASRHRRHRRHDHGRRSGRRDRPT